MIKDHFTIEEEASRLNKTFFLTSDDARKAVEDLEEKAPKLFKFEDLNILEIFPDGSNEPRYMPKFDFKKNERKVTIRKDSSLFGDTFPMFRKSDANIFSLCSIGLGNENIRKDISRSFSDTEEFLKTLYNENPTDPDLNADSLLESFAQKYFESMSHAERKSLYEKFIENDEGKRALYFETAEEDLDEYLEFLREGAQDYDVEEFLDYMIDSLNADCDPEDEYAWKTDWILDAVEENRKFDLREFEHSSDAIQVETLMENCMDDPEVHQYICQFLLDCVAEKYVLLPIDVYQASDDWGNPLHTWVDYDRSIIPDFEDIRGEGETQIVVARKNDIARKHFGTDNWDDEDHEEESQKILDELLWDYESFLNGEICERRVYRNGTLEYVEIL